MSLHRFPSIDMQPEFQVSFTLSVRNATALWSAAARKGLSAPGATIDDVMDVIGPREDPSIADCLAMLAAPAALEGCALQNFEVAETRTGFGRPLVADNDERQVRTASFQ